MAIFKHPDDTYRRYPPPPEESFVVDPPTDEYENPANWKPLDGARPGIEIHRDGKTMRNTAPTTPAKA